MHAIKSQAGHPFSKPKQLNFLSLLHHRQNQSLVKPSKDHKSLQKVDHMIEHFAKNGMQRIEDLQKAQTQFRYNVKMIEDREHAKRFAKLESLKKSKTEGDQRQVLEKRKKIFVLPNAQQKHQQNIRKQKRVKHHSSQPREKSRIDLKSKKIDFYDVSNEVQELNNRLNNLIEHKLSKLSTLLRLGTTYDQSTPKQQQNNHFYNDLNDLIKRIKQLKVQDNDKDEEIKLLNKKISYIQSLMAQNVTQSELLKKFYYNFKSNKSRNTIGKFMSMGPRVFRANFDRSQDKTHHQRLYSNDHSPHRPFFGESISNKTKYIGKQSFKPPEQQFYNSPKGSKNIYKFNDQPLPRSSYKRQFLNVGTLPFERKKGKDDTMYPLPKYTTTMKSRYNLDFIPQKTENIDFKQLDSYQDKLKFLEVSYFPTKQEFLQRSIKVLEDEKKQKQTNNNQKSKSHIDDQHKVSKQEAIFDKVRFVTQSQKSYGGMFTNERSKIKHQQLKEFQYRLKSIYKS